MPRIQEAMHKLKFTARGIDASVHMLESPDRWEQYIEAR